MKKQQSFSVTLLKSIIRAPLWVLGTTLLFGVYSAIYLLTVVIGIFDTEKGFELLDGLVPSDSPDEY